MVRYNNNSNLSNNNNNSMSDLSKSKGHSFAMERMMAKDEEDRLERVNTKQKRGTPTVRSIKRVI